MIRHHSERFFDYLLYIRSSKIGVLGSGKFEQLLDDLLAAAGLLIDNL